MLTDAQLDVIDKIPAEGSLSCAGGSFAQGDVDAVVAAFFEDKMPPAVKTATIMMGAPGAGKTVFALNIMKALPEDVRKGTIFIGYNEGGAEDHFAPFQQDMAGLSELEDRLAVARKFQPVTQRIQNETLKKSLREGFSILIDITAAGRGAGFLIDTLRKAGYERINLIGLHAPFDLAARRAQDRLRPADPIQDIVGKRSGVLAFMDAHIAKCNRADLYSNASDRDVPTLMMQFRGDQARILDRDLAQAFLSDIENDIPKVAAYLESAKEKYALSEIDSAKLLEDYKQASAHAGGFIREIMTPSRPLPQDSATLSRTP